MPLIVSGKVPKQGELTATGHKSSALLANQAKAELDKIVAMVIADMQKILPDWEKQPEAKSVLVALGELQAQWQAEIAAMANKVAAKWVDAVDKNSKAEITDSLRKSLGVNQAKILDGPGMKSTVVSMGLEAANLIKTIPGELLSGVADAVAKSYMQEPLPEGRTLAQEIAFQSGHAKKRARFIAKDQTQKMHGVVTRTRQAELGVEEFTWRTMRDQRVVGTPGGKYPVGSKLHGNHFDREGKVYRWDNLPSDGGPGWPIGCRCYAEPVIDMEKLNLVEVSQPTMEAIESTTPKPMTKAQPEPFPGFKAKQDSYLEKLVAQDQAKAATQAQYEAGQIGKDEYDATMLKIKKQALSLKSSLSKLKAQGVKAQAKAAPVTTTTKVEAPTAKPAEKPKLVAKAKPTPVQPAEDKELLAGKKVIADAYAYLSSIPISAEELAKLSGSKLTVMLGGLSLHLGKVSKIATPALASNVHVVKSALEVRQAMVTQAITSASAPKPEKKAPAAETSKSLELKEKINEFLGFTALEKSDMMSLEVGKLSDLNAQASQLLHDMKKYPELAGQAKAIKQAQAKVIEAWSEKTAPKKPEPPKAPAAVAPQVDLEDTLNMLMAQGKISFSQYQEVLTGGKLAPEIQKALDTEAKIAKKEAELTAGFKRADDVHKVATLDTRLTAPQSHAVRKYSGSEYSSINKAAATNDKREMLAAGYYDDIVNLDNAIDKSTVKEPVLVYRGVNGEFAKKLATLKKGDTLTLPAFTSTSSEMYVARNFAGDSGTVMQIQVPKGAKALSLYGNKLSGHQNEKELLLPRGSHFQVVENGDMGLILKVVRKKQ